MRAIAVNFPESDFPYSQLIDRTVEACGIAREAAAIAAESIATRSEILLDILRDHDKQLDLMEVEIGAGVAAALTQIDGREVDGLLACAKLAPGLKQISGLLVSTGTRAQTVECLDPQDTRDLIRMAAVLEKMLTYVGGAFASRDLAKAADALQAQSEMSRILNLFAMRHVSGSDNVQEHAPEVVSMANWLREAGDQAKTLAEGICHFVSGNRAFQDLITRNKPVQRKFLTWLQNREATSCRSDRGSVPGRTLRIQISPPFRTSRGIAR